VIVEVDERDIGRVRVGQPGSLALSALPWDTLAVKVTRVTPMANAVEGRNVFEVEAALDAQPDTLRPGLRGVARIAVGREPCCGPGPTGSPNGCGWVCGPGWGAEMGPASSAASGIAWPGCTRACEPSCG
jgi:hypothetical protein